MKPFAFLIVFSMAGLLSLPAAGAELKKIYRIGALNGSTPVQAAHLFRAFLEGLREHGFVEGENIAIEYRWAEGKLERLPGFAAELVDLKVDVIFAPPTPAAVAAQNVTKTIPIVFAVAADPVGNGLIANLARPGGNATGMSTINVELGAKRLELLKEAFPKISRVAVVYNPTDTSNQLQFKLSQEAAKILGLTLLPVGIERREDLNPAFAAVAGQKVDAFFVMENPTNFTQRQHLVGLIAQTGRPAMYALKEFVDAGGLMAYTVNFPDQFRRAAGYVAKILKGAKPADLPVEQPTRVNLVINLKAAKADGHIIPPELLLRADEVIR